MIQTKAIILKLYPTSEQTSIFAQSVGACRFIHNYFLHINNIYYTNSKQFLFYKSLVYQLPFLKIVYPWLSNVPAISLQRIVKNLSDNLANFKKLHKGYPKFKKKKEYSGSFYITNQVIHIIDNHHVKLPKVGIVKFRSKLIPNNIKILSGNIKRDGNDWFMSITYQEDIDVNQVEYNYDTTIGIDVGIKDFVITSNNEIYENKKYSKKYKKQLKLANKRLSRSKKGSKNRKKKLLRLHKIHNKIARRRQSYIHKVSSDLITKNSTICIENLNISGLKRNHKLAFGISDVSWGELIRQLKYKADWNGKQIYQIDRWYPSSQICSCCGHKQKMPLNKRTYICEDCGVVIDRDYNAAINIKREGIISMINVGGFPPEHILSKSIIDVENIKRLWRQQVRNKIKYGFYGRQVNNRIKERFYY